MVADATIQGRRPCMGWPAVAAQQGRSLLLPALRGLVDLGT